MYAVKPGVLHNVFGSLDVDLAAKARAAFSGHNLFLYAPQAPGVDLESALAAVLAGGPYEDGLPEQYLYAFAMICVVLGDRLDDGWGDGLDAGYLVDQFDPELASKGCALRLAPLLMPDSPPPFGIPKAADVPCVIRLSPLEAGTIAGQLRDVQMEYGEEQEVVDGWLAACVRAVERREDLVVVYA